MPKAEDSQTPRTSGPLDSARGIARRHWPLALALVILWAAVALLLLQSLRQNDGHFVYALDDPYIHMAMAKNFAKHGVWGITEHGFTSSSSSPLWTLLLSFTYVVAGVNSLAPLALNIIFGTLVLLLIYVLLRRYRLPPFWSFTALLATILFTPLPPIIFTGMENMLQILITIAFVYLAASALAKPQGSLRELSPLFILALLATAVRYEAVFLVLVVGVLFAVRKRLLHAAALVGLAALPIVAYGVVSVSNGWYFLPNSVILKAGTPAISVMGVVGVLYESPLNLLVRVPIVFIALALLYLEFHKDRSGWDESKTMLIVFLGTACLHLLFARTGWFYRYEAYLIALGVFVIAVAARPYLPRSLSLQPKGELKARYIGIAVLVLIVISPLITRSVASIGTTAQATTNIYQQQYQMGLFVREFYEGQAIAAGDIGAINYLADVVCLDSWGLANLDVAESKLRGHYDTQQMDSLARQMHVKAALVGDQWLYEYGGVPADWVKVGEWKISNNVVCGGDTVFFYAAEPAEESRLIENLRSYSPQLPAGVEQGGKYVES